MIHGYDHGDQDAVGFYQDRGLAEGEKHDVLTTCSENAENDVFFSDATPITTKYTQWYNDKKNVKLPNPRSFWPSFDLGDYTECSDDSSGGTIK